MYFFILFKLPETDPTIFRRKSRASWISPKLDDQYCNFLSSFAVYKVVHKTSQNHWSEMLLQFIRSCRFCVVTWLLMLEDVQRQVPSYIPIRFCNPRLSMYLLNPRTKFYFLVKTGMTIKQIASLVGSGSWQHHLHLKITSRERKLPLRVSSKLKYSTF